MDARLRARIPILLIAVAALVVACSGAPAGSPSTSPETLASPTSTAIPTASPSPTSPPDVAKLFATQLSTPGFAGGGPISGTMTLGNLEVPIAGEMQVDGEDSAMTLTIAIPGAAPQTTSTIAIDGVSYTAKDDGPWFKDPKDDAKKDDAFSQTMAAAALTAEDRGIVTKLGQQLHHLVPAAGASLTGAQLGMTDPSMADAAGTLEFYARDDGSLAVMSMGMDWTMSAGETPIDAAMAIDFTFEEGTDVAISAPTDVWTRFASKRLGYSIGHPADWEVIEGEDDATADVIGASIDQYTAVMHERQPKAAAGDLEAYAKAFIAAQRQVLKVKPLTDETVTVLGEPARRLTYREPRDADEFGAAEVATVYTLLIRGRDAYWVGLVGPIGYEADILALHDAQVDTFELTAD